MTDDRDARMKRLIGVAEHALALARDAETDRHNATLRARQTERDYNAALSSLRQLAVEAFDATGDRSYVPGIIVVDGSPWSRHPTGPACQTCGQAPTEWRPDVYAKAGERWLHRYQTDDE